MSTILGPSTGINPGAVAMSIRRVHGVESSPQTDLLAIEEPLEIRLGFEHTGRRRYQSISVTMRTPGHDLELAAGFLLTEGIVTQAAQIAELKHCGPAAVHGHPNIVRVELNDGVVVDLARLERHFYTSSSCGVCGKTSIEAVQVQVRPRLDPTRPMVDPALIHALPEKLRQAQAVFDRTGGLHASALFDADGQLLCVREDVGRHNALDKLIGAQLLEGRLPLRDRVLLLSGRASFELIQKAMMAGIAVVAAVGAPSSLAIELGRETRMTVLGFVRGGRFNVYCGAARLSAARQS